MSRFARVLLVILIGLGLAFGVFYFAGWPSSLQGSPPRGNLVGMREAAAGEPLHFGVPFHVVGKREVTITSVRLIDPSPGLALVSIRLNRFDAGGGPSVGALRGVLPDIERLGTAAGSRVKGGTRAQLVVTVRIASPGMYRYAGVVVRYRSGWLTRTAKLGPEATVDAPASPSPFQTEMRRS